MTFPTGWTIHPNYVNLGTESIDTAFLNTTVPSSAVRPTLTIGCFPKQPDDPPTHEEFSVGEAGRADGHAGDAAGDGDAAGVRAAGDGGDLCQGNQS